MTTKFIPALLLSALGLGPAVAQTTYSAAGKKAQVFTTARAPTSAWPPARP